jgi:2-iminobutanoate/2-iminopropanoate deaminase
MSPRSTYWLPGLAAADAVAPDLVRCGNLFFTSGIRGVDRTTGELPRDAAEQFHNAWLNLAALVESAGFSTDNIGLVTNFIDSQEYRAHINPGWLELFPERDNRPAWKTTSFPLPTGVGVELQAYGVASTRRTCIRTPVHTVSCQPRSRSAGVPGRTTWPQAGALMGRDALQS